MPPSEPSTAQRLHKAIRQFNCAKEETRDQELRAELEELICAISVVLLDVEGLD